MSHQGNLLILPSRVINLKNGKTFFGTPDEVAENARPVRNIQDEDGARKVFDEISQKGCLENFSGLKAVIVTWMLI